MTSLSDLPQELVDNIISFVSRRDCKSLRLTSKALADAAIPDLVRELHLAPHPHSFDNFERLASQPKFSRHVEGVKFFPILLPRFDGYAGWLECFDRVAIEKAWGEPINLPTSGRLYRMYHEYQQAVQSQSECMAEFFGRLRRLLLKLSRLCSLDVPMWYHTWRETPTAEHYGGSVCNFDKFWWLLKPKQLATTAEFCTESWLTSAWNGVPSMYRSSILEARTLGMQLLLSLQKPGPIIDEFLNVTSMSLAISLDAYHQDHGLFVEEQPREGASDESHYNRTAAAIQRCLETTKLPMLKSMCLHLQDGSDPELTFNVMDGLRQLLSTATALSVLHLRIDPDSEYGDYDILKDFADVHIPRLESLSLSSSFALNTCQASMERLLRLHKETLTRLSLHRVSIGKHRGSWEALLQGLPKILSLKQLHLCEVTEREENEFGHMTFFLNENEGGSGGQAICEYVTNGAPWPGWTSEVYR